MFRWRKATAVAILGIVMNISAAADPLVDAMVDEFFTELSKRYSFNRLRAPDVDDYIGHAFYVERSDVNCASDLVPFARAGKAIQVTKVVDFRDIKDLPKPAPTTSWTGIQLSTLITQGVEARITAKLPDRKADVQAAARSFRASNAQILVATRTVPLANYRIAAAQRLQELRINRASDIEVGAAGVVVPVSELLVQKFEFDLDLLKARNLSISAKFLELFGVKVAGEQSQALKSGYIQATNSVLAFKPISLLFENQGCPNQDLTIRSR